MPILIFCQFANFGISLYQHQIWKQKMETMYLSHLIFMMAILKPMDSKAKDVVAYFAVQVVNGVIIHALLHCVIYAKEYIKNVY